MTASSCLVIPKAFLERDSRIPSRTAFFRAGLVICHKTLVRNVTERAKLHFVSLRSLGLLQTGRPVKVATESGNGQDISCRHDS
jgi:hypothetical protein